MITSVSVVVLYTPGNDFVIVFYMQTKQIDNHVDLLQVI